MNVWNKERPVPVLVLVLVLVHEWTKSWKALLVMPKVLNPTHRQ